MTAPDPGLIDLIAAHARRSQYIFEVGPRYRCTCGWAQDVKWGDPSPFPAHLASVVEQHTNGRHEWPKTTPTGHTYERPTTYDELNGITADMAQGEIEGWEKTELPPEPTWPMVTLAQREIYRQSVRIAELEAEVERQKALVKWFDGLSTSAERTIARVNALKVNLFRRGGFIITKWEAARLVRAALEGEQQ